MAARAGAALASGFGFAGPLLVSDCARLSAAGTIAVTSADIAIGAGFSTTAGGGVATAAGADGGGGAVRFEAAKGSIASKVRQRNTHCTSYQALGAWLEASAFRVDVRGLGVRACHASWEGRQAACWVRSNVQLLIPILALQNGRSGTYVTAAGGLVEALGVR